MILPAYIGQEYAEKIGYERGGTIGKETYLHPSIDFTFTGVLPDFIPFRVGSIKESGIIERWTKLLWWIHSNKFKGNRYGGAVKNQDEPSKATIAGNILIVFIILLSGLFGGLCGFAIEIVMNSLTRLRK